VVRALGHLPKFFLPYKKDLLTGLAAGASEPNRSFWPNFVDHVLPLDDHLPASSLRHTQESGIRVEADRRFDHC
jgi:hypothetical protein